MFFFCRVLLLEEVVFYDVLQDNDNCLEFDINCEKLNLLLLNVRNLIKNIVNYRLLM